MRDAKRGTQFLRGEVAVIIDEAGSQIFPLGASRMNGFGETQFPRRLMLSSLIDAFTSPLCNLSTTGARSRAQMQAEHLKEPQRRNCYDDPSRRYSIIIVAQNPTEDF
jgi:hypothetical protein